jgi:hypothetical protein
MGRLCGTGVTDRFLHQFPRGFRPVPGGRRQHEAGRSTGLPGPSHKERIGPMFRRPGVQRRSAPRGEAHGELVWLSSGAAPRRARRGPRERSEAARSRPLALPDTCHPACKDGRVCRARLYYFPDRGWPERVEDRRSGGRRSPPVKFAGVRPRPDRRAVDRSSRLPSDGRYATGHRGSHAQRSECFDDPSRLTASDLLVL